MTETPPPRDRTLIEKEAVCWFTRMNGTPSRNDRRHFNAWLEVDENRLAYEHVASLWSSLGMLADGEMQSDIAKAIKGIEARRRQRAVGKMASVSTGCLVALGAAWIWLSAPNLIQDLRADYVSARGERRELVLADGSRVVMDADSALTVSLSDGGRSLRLLRGAAYFDVTHSPVRFTVEAENGHVEVLGTRFEIAETADRSVTVTLFEGSLAVGLTENQGRALLQPGQQVTYGAAGMGKVSAFDPEEVASWRNGRFVFTDAPLNDVVAEIARYHPGRVIVLGEALGERRISGTIALDKPEEALNSLQTSLGFRLSRIGSRLTLIGP